MYHVVYYHVVYIYMYPCYMEFSIVMGVPPNGWFRREYPNISKSKMEKSGVPQFMETPI